MINAKSNIALSTVNAILLRAAAMFYPAQSLAVTIPEDLAAHLGLERGKEVRIVPLDKRGFIVEVKE